MREHEKFIRELVWRNEPYRIRIKLIETYEHIKNTTKIFHCNRVYGIIYLWKGGDGNDKSNQDKASSYKGTGNTDV